MDTFYRLLVLTPAFPGDPELLHEAFSFSAALESSSQNEMQRRAQTTDGFPAPPPPGLANFRKQRFDLKFMHFLLNLSANWEKVQKRLHKWAAPPPFRNFCHVEPNRMCFRCSPGCTRLRCAQKSVSKTLYISISLAYQLHSFILDGYSRSGGSKHSDQRGFAFVGRCLTLDGMK